MEVAPPEYMIEHPQWYKRIPGIGFELVEGAPAEAKAALDEYKKRMRYADRLQKKWDKELERSSNAEKFGEIVDERLSRKK